MTKSAILRALELAPDDLLYAEAGRRRAAQRQTHGGGRPKKLTRCEKCGEQLGVREMREHRCDPAVV